MVDVDMLSEPLPRASRHPAHQHAQLGPDGIHAELFVDDLPFQIVSFRLRLLGRDVSDL